MNRRISLTKLDLSKVIIMALYNLENIPNDDNINVKRIMKKKKSELLELHKKAMIVINKKLKI